MTPTVKIVTGIASVGVVGSGIGYAISRQFATENISKKLTEAGYQILDETENTEWTSILTSYLATVNTKDSLKFKDFDIKEKEVEKLKQACKKALESPSTDNDSYKKAEYWCIVPKTVANLLDKEGYRALDTSDKDDNKDNKKWDTKVDDHESDKPPFKDKKFKDVPNIKSSKPAQTKKDVKNAIKNKCKELVGKRHYQADFKDNLEKAKLWCAIHKTADS